MAACTPATFGKGVQKVMDKTYAVAMDASKFATSFELGKHAEVLTEIQTILVADHGDGLVRAHPYKLNVYGQGGFFKAHRDTPRGDALNIDDGCEQRFAWGAQSSQSIQWCAFYSDFEHEVLPVTSGHRVTLTYLLESVPFRLLNDSGAALTVSSMEKTLREALADPAFAPNGAKLGFGLTHGYVVGKNGAVPMLKGADRALKATLDRLGLHYVFVPVYGSDCYDAANFKQAQDAHRQDGDTAYADMTGSYRKYGPVVSELELPGAISEEPLPTNQDDDDSVFAGDGANHLLVGTWKHFHGYIGMAPEEEFIRDGLDFENLGLHTTRSVLWIAPPVEFPMQKNGAAYGNEPTMNSYYAAASFIAWVPSWATRSAANVAPAAKKLKRSADEEQ